MGTKGEGTRGTLENSQRPHETWVELCTDAQIESTMYKGEYYKPKLARGGGYCNWVSQTGTGEHGFQNQLET